ncbi:hypothetical protein FSP39_001611 [Pinctada imbricata]|uniref:Fascin-like domain-containing protein n=1 Tax=Pinctada imbricata TaxID=66713 RepID=A0AA88XPB4_PINIB|nr:hypothetical protein FSP39_001611 [Pinctada imbricata]
MSEVNGINGHKAKAAGLQWKVGIVNSNNKYLTAEKFGNKVNVTGTALKSRQIWTLEQDTREEVVYIKSCSNHYLSSDKYGNVTCDAEEPGHSEKFTVEYAKDTGKWHFKHVEFPNYLSFDNDNLKCFKDELFTIEDSHPQVIFIANNGRKASIKYGVDVSANQEEEETDLETFQMEYDATHQTWSMKTTENKYWAVDAVTNGIQAKSESIKDTGRFNLEWQDDGTLAIRAHNKKYVHTRQNGSLFTTADSVGDTEKFRVKIVNRPQLVLKSEYGFVGIKGKPDKADAECCCNRVTYDVITLEGSNDGMYAFKASNGKYWSVGGDKRVMADGEGPTKFFIEFHGCSKLVIRTTDGTLLKGEQNGLFKADGTEINNLTQWEF